MTGQRTLRLGKKVLFAFLAVVVILLALEGLASVVWLVIDYAEFRDNLPKAVQFKEEHHCKHDDDLGWINIPGKHISAFYGPGRDITINNDGLRGLEDYLGTKPADRFRIVCLGDSFTLGYGVGDGDTFPAQIERINPRVQAVNMGQGGYSIGQCYLWHKKVGNSLDADCLVVTLILDDIWRMAGTRTANGYGMPGFKLRDGKLRVSGQPVPEKIDTGRPIEVDGQFSRFLAERNALARTFSAMAGNRHKQTNESRSEELIEITLVILSELQQETSRRKTPLLLVLLPELRELQQPALLRNYRSVSSLLRNFAGQNRILYLDLLDEMLTAQNVTTYYLNEKWHHLSEAGNELVATQIDRTLQADVAEYPEHK